MILSGQKIKQCVQESHIGIDPFIETNLKEASYTFTLDSKLRLLEDGQTLRTDVKLNYKEISIPEEGFTLQPGQFVLGFTKEHLKLNNKFACTLSARGSCAQIGLNILLGSHFAEPDTDSQLVLEISNVGGIPIMLFANMLIVKGVFMVVEQ
jgi:deoxycytidine triphosphate deaminase